MKDFRQDEFYKKLKVQAKRASAKTRDLYERAAANPKTKKTVFWMKRNFGANGTVRRNAAPFCKKLSERVFYFAKHDPQTTTFVFVCLSCAFAIEFLDKAFALFFLKHEFFDIFRAVAILNPSGWWFVILGALWLIATMYAGYSSEPEIFKKLSKKAYYIVFVLMTLTISTVMTVFLNILAGRYGTDALLKEGLYGFSSLSSGVSFPSWGAQSICAVMLAAGELYPHLRRRFAYIAGGVCLCLMLSGRYFISDVILGAYIGVMAFFIACWLVSETRENEKLLTFRDDGDASAESKENKE